VAATKKAAASAGLSVPAKVGVGVLFALLPAVAYYLVFHTDIEDEITSAKNQQARLRSELEVAKQAEEAYRLDVEELHRRQRNKAELVKVLPEDAEYHAFLSSVQNVANVVGVELVGWTPREEVPEQFYARVPMQLELRGRFHQLAKFFYNMGQSERIINMENISIKSPVIRDGEVYLSVSVLATAFHAIADGSSGVGGRTRRDR
jgi:type IV pilus assembly protein PilO